MFSRSNRHINRKLTRNRNFKRNNNSFVINSLSQGNSNTTGTVFTRHYQSNEGTLLGRPYEEVNTSLGQPKRSVAHSTASPSHQFPTTQVNHGNFNHGNFGKIKTQVIPIAISIFQSKEGQQKLQTFSLPIDQGLFLIKPTFNQVKEYLINYVHSVPRIIPYHMTV